MATITQQQQDTVCLRQAGRILEYSLAHGIENDTQRGAFLAFLEAWEKLSVDQKWDEVLESRLRSKPSLFNFSPPLEAKPTKPKGVLLKVPYWKQTDNYRDANRTCFSSSMAMIVEYLLPTELPNDDTYVKTVFNIGDTTDANVQLKALDSHKIDGTYRQNMDFADLDSELAQGYPVGVAILHRGSLASPTGGHWIVCIGRSEDGSKYQFNDPYGSLMDGYQGAVEHGQGVWYDRHTLTCRWTAEGPKTGWGMTCRKK